jgi:hypothetical protein
VTAGILFDYIEDRIYLMYTMSIQSVINLLHQPPYQALLFLLLTLLIIPLIRAKSANAVWNLAGMLYVGFIFSNTVFFWFEDGTWAYFFISLGLSLAYILAAGILVPMLINALKISGSGESATIFVFIMYHPVILLLMILVKWIVTLV